VFNPFRLFGRVSKWYSESISRRARIIIVLVTLSLLIGVGFTGYKIDNYLKTDPDACLLCHVHNYAQERWA